MEEVIYKHETNGEFTGIYAQIEDGKLTITEQDMGSVAKVRGCLRGRANQNILPSGIRRKE